jgi:hypothetical protein
VLTALTDTNEISSAVPGVTEGDVKADAEMTFAGIRPAPISRDVGDLLEGMTYSLETLQ